MDPVHEKGFAVFSPEELAYLADQRLARLATVDSAGQPTVDAVGFAFDRDRFLVGGRDLPATRKYRNVAAGNTKVSLIVDDLRSVDPWRPRGIRVFGTARAVTRHGMFGHGDYLEIVPDISWSWGIVTGHDDFHDGGFTPQRIVWDLRR
jgi:pyridoxamine 5'-phosphate oxidase family protein